MSNRLISIIMPVKNGHKYIRESLDAIKAQGMDVEVIVVDDGSTDDTAEIAQTVGCRVLRHETSKGPVTAKNTALAEAKGEYVMFHDHDDVMRPGALRSLYDAIEGDPEVYAVEAKVKDFHSPELTEEERRSSAIKEEAYYGLFTGAILMRRSVFEKIGPFPNNIQAGEIIVWNKKMADNGLAIKKLDMVSTDRRVHTTNFGKANRSGEFKDYASILRERMKALRK